MSANTWNGRRRRRENCVIYSTLVYVQPSNTCGSMTNDAAPTWTIVWYKESLESVSIGEKCAAPPHKETKRPSQRHLWASPCKNKVGACANHPTRLERDEITSWAAEQVATFLFLFVCVCVCVFVPAISRHLRSSGEHRRLASSR